MVAAALQLILRDPLEFFSPHCLSLLKQNVFWFLLVVLFIIRNLLQWFSISFSFYPSHHFLCIQSLSRPLLNALEWRYPSITISFNYENECFICAFFLSFVLCFSPLLVHENAFLLTHVNSSLLEKTFKAVTPVDQYHIHLRSFLKQGQQICEA